MSETRDAHFLHDQQALNPVLSPPVEDVRAIGWVPGKQDLLIASADGELVSFDPVMGSRTIADDLEEAGALAVNPTGETVAILYREAGVQIRSATNGTLLHQTEDLGLLADLWIGWWREGIAVTGQSLDGRILLLIDAQGQIRARGKLPPGAAVGPGRSGGLLLGRATAEGIDVVKLGVKLPSREPTGHRLRFSEKGVLYGTAEGGVTVWTGPKRPPVTVRTFGITSATVSGDGKWVGIGTRDGHVALASIRDDGPSRGQPVRCGGHEEAVHSVTFSTKGKWMASAGYDCWIWRF